MLELDRKFLQSDEAPVMGVQSAIGTGKMSFLVKSGKKRRPM